MELEEPKAKKYWHLKPKLPLPIELKKDNSVAKVSAVFNGFSVVISNEDEMKKLISMGSFGKANFSRSFPQFTGYKPEFLRERQFKNRKKISQNLPSKSKSEKVIVVPDSDPEDLSKTYFTNLKPLYEIDNSGLQEFVWLGLEEAFFLAEATECLEITYKTKILSTDEAWNLFCENQPEFEIHYAVYYYYRSKNWVVKPGIKFGGDFLLYKQSPAHFHASYVVIIEKSEENRHESSFDNISLFGLNRLCETAAKELIICKVHWPKEIEIDYKNLKHIQIQEILLRRWTSTSERES